MVKFCLTVSCKVKSGPTCMMWWQVCPGLGICSFAYHSNQMSECKRFAQIAQDKWATLSKLLRLLISEERPWANLSGCSWQMSDRERFAQVAHHKWANERFAKKNFWLKLYFFIWYVFFILKNERFAYSLFFNQRCEQKDQISHQKWAMWAKYSGRSPKMSDYEQFAQIAHQKWATMSKSLRLLTKNEWPWANCFFLERIAHLLIFLPKTSDSLRKPMSKFQPWICPAHTIANNDLKMG